MPSRTRDGNLSPVRPTDPVPLVLAEAGATAIEAAICRRALRLPGADAITMSALGNAASLAAAAIRAGLLR